MNRRKKINSSEDKYRYIFEYANEAILVVQDGLLKLFNPKLTEATGYSEEEIKDKPFIEFIHKDDREMVSDYYQRRLKGEEIPEVYPFRIIDKNGDTKWIEIHAVLIDWEDKPATLSFLDDITERKKAEDELLIEQDFKKSLMDITPAFFVVIDAEFKILMMNKSMLNALGYKEDEVIGINYLSTFIPKNEYKQVTKVLQRCLSGELTTIENHIIAKDSRMLLVEWHGCPIRDLNNKVESFFGVGIDITERG